MAVVQTVYDSDHKVEFVGGSADGEILRIDGISKPNEIYKIPKRTRTTNIVAANTMENIEYEEYVLLFVKFQNRFIYFHHNTYKSILRLYDKKK